MYLWLERYILPVCAAVVFGLTILNPLKLDWQQRVSLAIAISAIAYFVGHTLRKPASAPIQADQRITFLQQQVQSLQSRQAQDTAQEEAKVKEKVRRQEVRRRLAVFLQEGQKIQNGIHYYNPALLQEKPDWERRVAEYLSKNLDESYAVRFRNPSHQVSSYPAGINTDMMGPWGEVTARMAMLNDFISELRD